jgi:hypothetical protein
MPDQPLRHSAASPSGSALPSVDRRKFLGTTLLAGTALLAASEPASAFALFRGSSKLDTSNLPRGWVRRQGGELHAYAKYLSSLRLRHIGTEDVIAAHAKTKGNLWNNLPPRSLWKNMGRTLWVADEVAHRLGGSIKEVTSAYRSPSYNARCLGAKPNSFHKSNFALDLKFYASPSTVVRIARSVRSEGRYQGGIGRYSGFTHIDTRGYNVDW